MEPKPLDSAGVYKLQHTPSGNPYIEIPSRSPTPIYLTKYYVTDIPTVYSVLTLPAVNLFLISAPWPYALADAEWWVNSQLTSSSDLNLQILRSGSPDEDGTLLGSVSLERPGSGILETLREKLPALEALRRGKECELGYYLHPDWRGKGIMKSGVKALLAWARAECDVQDVMVRVVDDNWASRRVIESLGDEYFARVEGEDHEINWPENKRGGGTKKILVWKWHAS